MVLSILAGEESYGYEIIQKVRELSGGHIEWSDGMLYPVLHRLEREGLIESGMARSGNRARAEVLFSEQGRAQGAAERAAPMAGCSQYIIQIMATQTRFNLNAAVENWRNELATQPQLTPDDWRRTRKAFG